MLPHHRLETLESDGHFIRITWDATFSYVFSSYFDLAHILRLCCCMSQESLPPQWQRLLTLWRVVSWLMTARASRASRASMQWCHLHLMMIEEYWGCHLPTSWIILVTSNHRVHRFTLSPWLSRCFGLHSSRRGLPSEHICQLFRLISQIHENSCIAQILLESSEYIIFPLRQGALSLFRGWWPAYCRLGQWLRSAQDFRGLCQIVAQAELIWTYLNFIILKGWGFYTFSYDTRWRLPLHEILRSICIILHSSIFILFWTLQVSKHMFYIVWWYLMFLNVSHSFTS